MFYGRGVNKIQNPITLADIYDDFVKEIGKDSPYYVDKVVFYSIYKDYINGIINNIILKGLKFKFPFGLGNIQVIKQKINFKNESSAPIDWKTTVEIGKRVRHFNDHSGGYKYTFRWSKINAITLYKNFYAFKATRSLKRELARKIKNKEQDYFLFQKSR